MADNLEREKEIFSEALELPSSEARRVFLTDACGSDHDLREKIEALLAAFEVADRFIPTRHDNSTQSTEASVPVTEKPGDQIGRYKLLEKLGEGGFGVVYMAEQREPVKRRVALKIIKVGMDTREVVARFEAERQALALMDHPNIAKIYDAGSTERPLTRPAGTLSPTGGEGRGEGDAGYPRPSDGRGAGGEGIAAGRPYFVMELVRGIKLTDYCDERNLSTRERLELFMRVCQAVQHAHQKGIIHRDLKPSNILVTVNDGQAVPKIIDFGIAKATQMELTEKTVFTRFQQFLGTPAYMSPEQADLSSVDVDTRSDIYSLGVLLYELLTGRTPFDAKELLKAGLDEMRRTIREKEPERPSTRVSTLRGDELTTTAKRRGLDAPKLINVLCGDLDWIVMKCLEKDRARRYETAVSLAAEIERHLSNEPITARPPSTLYQLRKAVQRKKLAFTAGAAVFAALIIGLSVSLWQSIEKGKALQRALAAESLATDASKEAKAVTKFLTDVLKSPDPARDGHSITVAEILVRAAKNLETELKHQPARKAKLQETLGLTYISLGLYQEAIPLQEKVLDYYRATSGRELDALFAMNSLAISYDNVRRWEEAVRLQESAVAQLEKLKGPNASATLLLKGNLASFYADAGRPQEALQTREDLLALNRMVNGPPHSGTLREMYNLSMSYHDAGRRAEAIKLGEELVELSRQVFGPEHPRALTAMGTLAVYYAGSDARRRTEALKMREELLPLHLKVFGPDHFETRNAIQNLADSYANHGRYAEAERLLSEALSQARQTGTNHPSRPERWLSELADLHSYYLKQYSTAEALYQELLASRRRRFPADDIEKVVEPQARVGRLLADWAWAERTNAAARARAYEAERILRECIELRLKRTNASPWKTCEWKSRLGSALVSVAATDREMTSATHESKFAEAESLLLEADGGVLQSPAAGRLYKRDVLERFVRLYEAWDKPAQASEWRAKLKRFELADAEPKSSSTAEALE